MIGIQTTTLPKRKGHKGNKHSSQKAEPVMEGKTQSRDIKSPINGK